MASRDTRRAIVENTRDLLEGQVEKKAEQKGENVTAITAECEQGEDYLVIEYEEC